MISQGLKIGDYEIVDKLGRGGFGSVYLGKDLNTGQTLSCNKVFNGEKIKI